MLRKLLLLAIGFAIPLGVGEAVLQVWDPYHYGEKEDHEQYLRKVFDMQTGRLRPGARATYLGTKTEIGAHGFRTPAFAIPKPDDVFRVLLLGGSVAYGWGVEQGDEYPRVLERKLNAKGLAKGKRIEVINTGVPGWKLEERGRFLHEVGAKWQPDLVLLTLIATDVPTKRAKGRPAILSESLRHVRLLRAAENRYMLNTPRTASTSYDAYEHLDQAGLEWVGGVLEMFKTVVHGLGARFVVYDTLGRDITRKRCAKLGIHRIEGYTKWALRRSWEVAATDFHPNKTGHAFLADMVFGGLQDPKLWSGK